MITSGSIALTAVKEYGRYQIKCSTGETIPVDTSGAPISQVSFTFYKVSTDGVMSAFSASQVYYELLASDGSSVYDDSLAGISLLDVTDDLTNYRGQFKSVRLTVYGSGHEVLAVQSFGATEPGSDAEIYVISLTSAYYTMNGLKEINAKLAGKLYKRKGTTTTPVSGATVKIGYVNGSTTTALTDSSGAFDDSDWFVGDIYTDTSACNSSPSIFVSYELNGVTQASQYVSLAQQGDDGEPGSDGVTYDIVLNTGDTVPCTAYAELITDIISVTLLKNGTSINFGIDLKIKDNNGNVLSSWMTGFYPGYQIQPKFAEAIATGTAPRSIYIRAFANVNGQNQVVTEKTFAVTYETPVPYVRDEEWSADKIFKNGDIIIYKSENQEYVFKWNYQISGNSTVNPFDDVKNNSLTTHWVQYQIYPLLATRILLAAFALVGGSVFMDDYMISRHGTIDGVESDDYTKFDADNPQGSGKFIPTFYVNFKTGETYQTAGKIGGFDIGKNFLNMIIGAVGSNYQSVTLGAQGLEFYDYRNNQMQSRSRIGNLADASLGAAVNACLEQTAEDGANVKVGLLSRVSGAVHPFAFFGVGNMVTDGMACGFNVSGVSSSSSTNWATMPRIDVSKANFVIVNGVANGKLALPTMQELLAAIGISSTSRWLCMELTVLNNTSSTQTIYGNSSDISGTHPGLMPSLYNGNNRVGKIAVGAGKVIKFLLLASAGNNYIAKIITLN